MRRLAVVLSALAVVLLGALAVGRLTVAMGAQEGTPAAEGDAPGGVTFDPLAVAPGQMPPNPADLVLVRIGLDPGASLPSDPADPTIGFVLVESGELTIALDGPVTVTRAGAFAAAVATSEAGGEFPVPDELVPAGETVILAAGDVGFFPANVGGEVRNDGQERAVGLALLVTPPEGGGATPAVGTPAP